MKLVLSNNQVEALYRMFVDVLSDSDFSNPDDRELESIRQELRSSALQVEMERKNREAKQKPLPDKDQPQLGYTVFFTTQGGYTFMREIRATSRERAEEKAQILKDTHYPLEPHKKIASFKVTEA